ncbi:hypothetical protein E2C01_007128 [Portunus trituberculatus]|uniref:Uncharacterized protein n=1 Tax=Portunus trituberculatus TaxID=210409 RepID=A0A5B7CZ85_PORTR|nr:hypothetical protein [Portunus trituberculatus]
MKVNIIPGLHVLPECFLNDSHLLQEAEVLGQLRQRVFLCVEEVCLATVFCELNCRTETLATNRISTIHISKCWTLEYL